MVLKKPNRAMKETRPDPLLKEILAGADLAGFRRASLERGLTTRRPPRRQRRVVRVCAAASMLLVVCAVVVFNQSRGAAERRMAAAAPSSVARDRKSVVEGKRGDLGCRRISK